MTPLDVISRFGPHGGTLTSLLRSRVESRGAHPFLEFAGSSLTYAAFEDKVARVAGMLASRGIREGDRIGLMSFNHPVIPLTLFAAARLGAVAVPVNPEFLKEEAAYVLGHAGVSALICSPDCMDVAVAATQGMDHRPWIMTHGAAAVVGASHERPDFEGELERTTLRITDDHGRADSTVILVYSSGTTGFPKGVMHCQRTLCLSGEAFVARVDIKPDDRMLVMMPMFHVNAVFYSLAGTLPASILGLDILEGRCGNPGDPREHDRRNVQHPDAPPALRVRSRALPAHCVWRAIQFGDLPRLRGRVRCSDHDRGLRDDGDPGCVQQSGPRAPAVGQHGGTFQAP